jgi:hypothetical protein
MRTGMKWMALGSVGLALCAGCVEPGPEPTGTTEAAPTVVESTEADVVLRLELEEGHDVTFYEPAPGGLFLVERMTPTQSFVLKGKEASDALLAFERLRPGEPVPAALQAAYDRARNLPGDPAPREPQAGSGQPEAAQTQAPGLGVAKQALVSSSYAATFVNDNGGCDWGAALERLQGELGQRLLRLHLVHLGPVHRGPLRRQRRDHPDHCRQHCHVVVVGPGHHRSVQPGRRGGFHAAPARHHQCLGRQLPRGLPLGRLRS